MEPRQHEVAMSTERAPVQRSSFEAPASPDHDGQSNLERRVERAPELGQVQTEASQIAMPTLPMPVLTTNTDDSVSSQGASTPSLANDDDLIEKEWIDQAKKIIAATREDPYRREQEISKLQIEYIRKRYGRVIGEVSE